MYAVDFIDNLIIPLNGANDHHLKAYSKYDTYKEAKQELLNYWENQRMDADFNIKKVRKMKE